MDNFQKIKIKYVSDLFTGNSIPDNEKGRYVNGSIPYIPTKELDAETGKINYDNGLSINADDGFRIAPANSILMCIEGGSAGKKVGIAEKQVAFVNKLCCFCSFGLFYRLLYYCLLSKDFQEQFHLNMTGIIGGVSVSTLKNLYITLPPVEKQHLISAYLDAQTEKINALIANNEAQIEKLRQYKQSLITETVTRGLDPNAPMKDSGNEFIGEIPAHWMPIKIKYLCDMQAGNNLISEQIAESGNYPVYGGNGIRGYFEKYNYDGEYLLVGRQGALCGNVHYATGKFWATEHAVVTTPKENVLTLYLYYLLTGMNLNLYVSPTAAQPGLSVYTVQNIVTCLPPMEEQIEAVKLLQSKAKVIDAVIALKQSKIEKLKQYRQSLIYEYVTGKKEVRPEQ